MPDPAIARGSGFQPRPAAVLTRTPGFWLVILALVLLTGAAHFPGLRNDFVLWDDDTHITQNPVIRSFTWDNITTMFTRPIAKQIGRAHV